MTDTLEHAETGGGADAGPTRSRWMLAVAAVLLLGVGLVAGWAIRGDSDDSRAVTLVTADGSELTAEQEQMWGMLERYVDEVRNGDYEAAESWFSDDGGIRVLDGFDIPYGEFEMMLPNAPWLFDQVLGSALVYEDHIVFFHRDVNGLVRSNDVRFGDFDDGEFHIEEHRITD